jgi:hypothetical protein
VCKWKKAVRRTDPLRIPGLRDGVSGLPGQRANPTSLPAGGIEVYFSPKGGCTDAVVKALGDAKQTVYVQAYARAKEQLCAVLNGDVDAYLAIKDPVCDLIYQAAEARAAATQWEPGPSDA